MIDSKAFRSISYGLYLIASCAEGKTAGCVVNSFAQVTSKPFQVSVAVNKENHTCSIIRKSGKYTATVLAEGATMELIGRFGFKSSRDLDKFELCATKNDEFGLPYVLEHTVARFSVVVSDSFDFGTHIMFIGAVTEAEVLSNDTPMTYSYYHIVKGGKTPPQASSYIPDKEEEIEKTPDLVATKAWYCTVCGHIEYADKLPKDFTCPVCGAGVEFFELVEEK